MAEIGKKEAELYSQMAQVTREERSLRQEHVNKSSVKTEIS